jgi:hypothetical protein
MTLTRKDAVATSLTGLAVLAFLATHEAWNVPLIGDSHRWAAAVILVLGVGACATPTPPGAANRHVTTDPLAGDRRNVAGQRRGPIRAVPRAARRPPNRPRTRGDDPTASRGDGLRAQAPR